MKKSYRRIKAVVIANDILRYLAEQTEPASAQQIAQFLGIPCATVVCYLATLEDGHLVKEQGGNFEIGPGMAIYWHSVKNREQAAIDRARANLKRIGVEEVNV